MHRVASDVSSIQNVLLPIAQTAMESYTRDDVLTNATGISIAMAAAKLHMMAKLEAIQMLNYVIDNQTNSSANQHVFVAPRKRQMAAAVSLYKPPAVASDECKVKGYDSEIKGLMRQLKHDIVVPPGLLLFGAVACASLGGLTGSTKDRNSDQSIITVNALLLKFKLFGEYSRFQFGRAECAW